MSCVGKFPLRTLRVTYRDIVGERDPKDVESRRNARRREEEDVGDIQPRRGAEITHDINSDAPLSQAHKFENEIIVSQVWEDRAAVSDQPRLPRSSVPTETLTPYSYQINRIQVRYQSRNVFDHRKGLVLDLVQKFDREIEGINVASFRGERPAIYLSHRRLGPMPLSVFGDGIRRAVLLATILPTLKDGGLLLIDEIETGIHVSALERVFAWLTKAARDFRVQIVATTHSLEAVDAIALSAPEGQPDLVTFHLDQTEQETRVKRIDGELLLRLRRERGLDVR